MFHLERWHRGECLLLLLTCRQARLGTQTPTTRHLKVASRGWGGSVTRVTVRSFSVSVGYMVSLAWASWYILAMVEGKVYVCHVIIISSTVLV